MANQVTFSISDSLKKLAKSLEDLAPQVEAEINQAVKETAYAAYASIVAKAQGQLNSTRQDYLKGLEITELGDNTFVISLEGDWANKLEAGFPAYVMNEILLKSQKIVQVGSRQGKPWVQNSVPAPDGTSHKFAHVPFEHHPFSKAAGNADMAAAIQSMTATGINEITQKITKIYKDDDGNALEGRVAVGKSDNSKLDNLTKFQKIYKGEGGKQTVQSIYMTWRTISSNGKPWIRPAYEGLKAFEAAEKEVERNLEAIVKALVS